MDAELSNLPACCRHSLKQIGDKIEAAGCLEEFMAVAPNLSAPMLRVSLPGILWEIGKGIYNWRRIRKSATSTLEPILQNRIQMIIDTEVVRHSNDSKLSKQWNDIKRQLVR